MNIWQIFILFTVILVPLIITIELFLRSSQQFHKRDPNQQTGLKEGIPKQVSEELGHLNLPQEKVEEAAKCVTKIVDREVEQRMNKMRDEVKDTYAQVIKNYNEALETKDKNLAHAKKEYETIHKNFQTQAKEKKQTESVVKSLAKGMIVLNDQGEVVFVNPVAEKILGVKAEDILGKPINNTDGEHVISLVDDEGAEHPELKDKNKDTKEILKESTAIIQGPSGQTKGVVSILGNTVQKKKIDEYKTEFLANVTHELRSPLICVLKSIAIINEEMKHASDEHKNYLKIALRNAERLEKLVNDILDISKMEAGKMPLRYEMVTAKAFFQDIEHMFSAWSKDKNIQITHKTDPDLIFEADPERLRQVVVNLGANALKFTPRGGKIVFEAALHGNNGTSQIHIGVRDNGPGLSEDDMKNLFTKFSSGLQSEGNKGTGLGLTIAKEIVELHHGKIWAENNKDRGSYFGFSIPKNPPGSIYAHPAPKAA